MVSVTADLGYFSDYWGRVRLPYDGRVTLRRAAALDILAIHPAIEGLNFAAAPSDIIRSAIAANPKGGTFDFLLGEARERRIGAYAQVSSLPLYVTVSISRAAVTQAWIASLRSYMILAALALSALAVLTWVAFRQARKETEARTAIEEARAELAHANEGLEATVAERTAELRESNEEIQRYAYIVSHDLRAPLVNIMGFTSELEALRDEILGPDAKPLDDEGRARIKEDYDEALGFIRAAIDKMEGLIAAILKLSREGRRTFNPEPLDMNQMLEGLAAAQRHQFDTAGVELTIQPGLPGIMADRLAIEQIFANLIDNAVKYLDPARPGHVEIRGEITLSGRARYHVRDNGRGIAPQDHARIFELFRRAGRQDKPGEGIGLAHVRTLVRTLAGAWTFPRNSALEPRSR